TLPLHLRGPLDNPRVSIDSHKLADNLLATGATELGNRLKQEASQRVDELKSKAAEALEGALEKGSKDAAKKLGEEAKKSFEDLNPFGKKKKDDKKKDEPKKDGGN